MNILITGGAGFLGTNLAQRLLLRGHRVVVVDNLSTGSIANVNACSRHARYLFYEMGVETTSFTSQFIHSTQFKFDRVYHLACPTGVPNIEYLGEEMLDASSVGTKNVLNVALKHNAKLLFTSSSEIYGAPQVFPQGESYTGNVDPQGWRASYEEGKRFSEALISLYVKKYGLHAFTVRLFNVYGPHMSAHDQRVVPRFLEQALRGEPITVHDNIASRTFCYVDDILDGFEMIFQKGCPGDIFNLGSDEEISVYELANAIKKITESESEINFIPGMSHDHQRRVPDLSKINALGWRRRVPLTQGLKATAAFYTSALAPVLVT